jgi:uncharacterized protein YjiS (DUF1127 family)
MELIMSTIFSPPAAAQRPGRHSRTSGLAATLKRWWVAYITWRIERRAIFDLSSMTDRDLKDIGVARCEIMGAVREVTARDRASARELES